MELTVGTKLSNFTVTNIRPIPGKDAQLIEMVYEKTATELAWVKSAERNKLFSIAFKTIPEDDTGVFHILEHSVLCGSEKYPVKEPFVELLKSSMNTFLNAMTFPDKTMYPVSSRNEQDFLNLTNVYLDAVFAPAILKNPNIYRQEGWHYELEEENLSYNGVVFNEMKGAMSSVDEVAEMGIMNLLFPDNCYRFNSGGDPTAIPNLTYQQFVDSYNRYYHPTNARIFLDGDIPLEKTLSLLDSYLSRYEMGTRAELNAQMPVSREHTVAYEATEDGTPKAQFVLGKILGSYEDMTTLLARKVLCDVLAGSNDAPLKRTVLDTGLCQDLTLGVADGMLQPFMVLRLHNMEDKDAAQLHQVIRDFARQLLRDGIPAQKLTASINHLSFQARAMREPQALIRCIESMNSWLYGGDPMLYLDYTESIDALRAMVENGGFEKLLEEMLLDEEGLCKLHVLPSPTHGAELREAELNRLAAEKQAMTQQQLEQVAQEFQVFSQWQQTPDSPENLQTLPKLSLSEISPEPVATHTEVDRAQDVTLLRHKLPTNGIIYLSAYFTLTDCTAQELTQLSLLPQLLSNLPAGGLEVSELQNQVKTYLGELKFAVDIFSKKGQREECTPILAVYCSVLKENLPKAQELIHKILTATDFSQADRIRQIVLQAENEAQQYGMMGGHSLASCAARSHYSATAAANEAIRGITSIQWLHKLAKEFDSELPGFTALMNRVLSDAVCRSRMTLGVTEEEHSDLDSFVSLFPQGQAAAAARGYESQLPRKLGIRIPAQVSYACLGYDLAEQGVPYNGTAALASNIISLGYLWNEVRVQGGAYGAGMRMGSNGALTTYSYRDPSPSRSLEVYRNMGKFLKEFSQSGQDITGFIISSISDTEPLVSPAVEGRMADRDWFSGYTLQDARVQRQQMLSATPEALEQWCGVLDALRENAAVCVVGYADALESCAGENLTVIDI